VACWNYFLAVPTDVIEAMPPAKSAVCAFCREEAPIPDTPEEFVALMAKHIVGCEMHPMRAVVVENERGREQLAALAASEARLRAFVAKIADWLRKVEADSKEQARTAFPSLREACQHDAANYAKMLHDAENALATKGNDNG
jgi:hypothetical protein